MQKIMLFLISIISTTVPCSCGEWGKMLSVGQPAPDFTLTDIQGQNITLKNYQGKTVLIVFWAISCPVCVDEIPELIKLFNEYKDKKFALLGINIKESPSKVKPFAQDKVIPYPVLLDQTQEVTRLYGVGVTPTNFIIDDQGIIQDIIFGSNLNKIRARLSQMIR